MPILALRASTLACTIWSCISVDAGLIFVVQADVKLGDRGDLDADVRQIRAIIDDRASHVRAAAAHVHERQVRPP